jgi:hypothetical protein
MKRLLNKIKKLFPTKSQLKIQQEKIDSLETRLTNLEKANLVVLTKLLQAGELGKQNNKIENKSKLLITSHKDLDAGKTPTYH